MSAPRNTSDADCSQLTKLLESQMKLVEAADSIFAEYRTSWDVVRSYQRSRQAAVISQIANEKTVASFRRKCVLDLFYQICTRI